MLRSRWSAFVLPLAVLASATIAEAQPDAGTPPAPALTPPRLIEAPPVTLPEGAEPLPPDASVELLVTVTPEGTVREARVITSLREDVDALVLEAAQGMRFEPATRDGQPILARIRFRYRITTPPPPPVEEEEEEQVEEEEEAVEEEAVEEEEEEIAVEDVETEGISELGVEARAERPEPGAASRITLQAEELTTVPGTFGEPLRVVATLPGVLRTPFGLGFFFVRGANAQNTGFMVDGFPVPLLYHLGAGPAVISSRFVSRLDFYAGGYPATFGRFSAGLVSLETAPPPAESIRGEVEVDLFRASALAVVPFDNGRGSVAGAIRRSYYELLLPLVQPGLELAYTDYQLRGDYRIDSRVSLSLFFFGSDDYIDQTGAFGSGVASEGTQTRYGSDFQRLIARVNLRLPEQVRLSIAGMWGRDGTGFESAQPGSDPLRFALQNTYGNWRADLEVPWMPELQTNLGLDINAQIFDVEASAFVPAGLGEYPRPVFTPQQVADPITRGVVRGLAALYIDQIVRLGPVEISAAGRFDYMRYGDVSEVFPDPRLVVRWRVVPELLLKVSTGLFSQPPIAFQLARDGGNPELRPERAWQSSFGVEAMLPERVEVQATGFYNQMFDLVEQVNRVVPTDDGGAQRQYFANEGEGRAYGLEVLIRRRIEQGLYGWLSYTLSRSERLDGNGEWEPFAFDQTHVLNLAASYFIDGWRFGISFQVATGRPDETLVRTIYDSDGDEFDPTFRDLGGRLPTYHRLDVRIDRDFEIGPVRGSVYLDVQNIYNSPNNEGVLYSYDYSESTPLPGIPILPTIGVRGSIQ